ncbi:MAG: histidine triad nucleotide-binding protein [Oscillospiraceae bacterium]|nr:histidine triad nucleotide-binding protein [Oscillospiraceae bacterium]
MPDCIFCKIVEGTIPSPRIYENDDVIVINDIEPVSKVHTLIITKKHYTNLLALDIEDAGLLRNLHLAAREAASRLGVGESGFRLITNCGVDGGQSIDHLHFHLIGGQKLGPRIF